MRPFLPRLLALLLLFAAQAPAHPFFAR